MLRSAVRRRVLFSDPQTDRDFVRKYVANLEEARLSDCNVDNHIFSDFLKSGFDGSDFPKNRVLLSRETHVIFCVACRPARQSLPFLVYPPQLSVWFKVVVSRLHHVALLLKAPQPEVQFADGAVDFEV